MAKRWQKEDLAYLKKHGTLQGVAELAAHFEVEKSAVVEKLAELGIVRIVEATRTYGDATSAALLAEGLEHLQRGDWKKAAERFEKVLVEDDGVIAARARQFLAISKQREAAAGKSPVRGAEDSFLEAVMLRNRGDLDAAIDEMIAYKGPVIFDCRVSALANCFPMIPSGKAHNEMIMGEDVSDEAVATAIDAAGNSGSKRSKASRTSRQRSSGEILSGSKSWKCQKYCIAGLRSRTSVGTRRMSLAIRHAASWTKRCRPRSMTNRRALARWPAGLRMTLISSSAP